MNQIEAIKSLNLFLAEGKLPQKNIGFARSLIDQYKTKGRLSDKQWPYVTRMVEEVMSPPPKREVNRHKLMTDKIEELFNTARESILEPKLVFGDDEHTVKLSTAGATARFPGSLNVILDGEWIGRIREGEFESTRIEAADTAIALLIRFAEDPSAEARAYGQQYGICCVCGAILTNKKSREAGIGPICASNWGL